MIRAMTDDYGYPHRHLLGIQGLYPWEIKDLLDRADGYVEQCRSAEKKSDVLRGRTMVNLFYESSTALAPALSWQANAWGWTSLTWVFRPPA